MSVLQRIAYGDTVIEYKLTLTDGAAKRVRIHVEPDARVIVEAPAQAKPAAVRLAVRQRARWIHRHLEAIRARPKAGTGRDWVSGESHRYLGRRYMLKVEVAPSRPERVTLAGGQLRVTVRERRRERVQELVLGWYRERARETLARRASDIATRLPWVSRTPPLGFRRMTSRWGSCSPAGRLTLNPLLVRAPREAIDYVIVHELCHLKHHHHGPAFYRLLSRYVPEWQTIKLKLDQAAASLFAEEG